MKHKLTADKTWNWFRKDVDERRAREIADEQMDALFDRMHNAKEFFKHPFNKKLRETVPTYHHYK